jgi:hypothetical protein
MQNTEIDRDKTAHTEYGIAESRTIRGSKSSDERNPPENDRQKRDAYAERRVMPEPRDRAPSGGQAGK